MSELRPDGGIEVTPADLERLEMRWARSWDPSEVAERLDGIDAPWAVAAGWALELFLGKPMRAHGDIEIAVPAARFGEVRERFPEYAFDAVGDHRIWEDASAEVLAATHQTWVRDRETGDYLLDVFREPHADDVWVCRRDETIRLPYADVILRTADGIPYLAPEIVLLFKAKGLRDKDQADFEAARPVMTQRQCEALSGLLSRVHPGHPWLAGLASQPRPRKARSPLAAVRP
ncbi:MAG TPA: hypothetical protein VFN97_12500 [Actinospica sp.]|nr:hypothetical protein [Actinospica sp.]